MASKKTLDFIIIGAQKAGTTSLFKYMAPHPQIYMPPEKECPYFNDDERISRGWEWYVREFFDEAPEDTLWGKATPHYMGDFRVPGRIKAHSPSIKLIALLRNPIERAYSHYMMNVRRSREARSFEDAVLQLLRDTALDEAREQPTETNSYLIKGEYGRLLALYYELFPADQILTVFTEELESLPEVVLHRAFSFLAVEPDFVPANLGIVYHKGGVKRRLPWVDRIRSAHFARSAWRTVAPKYRRRFMYWFEQWNVIPEEIRPIHPSLRQILTDHYQDDIARLSALIGRSTPWADWV